MSEWEGYTFEVTPEPEPPPMKPGDKVTWMDDDGVAELVVVDAEPWTDEDGAVGQSIRFAPAPAPEKPCR